MRWLALLLLVALHAYTEDAKMPERWVYARAALGDDAGLEKFTALLKEAKAAGCTHALLIEGRWLKFPDEPAYLARVETAKAAAKDLNIRLIPSVFSVGYSGRYFHWDPNLVATLPVKDMPFVVKGKTAVADPAGALAVDPNGKEGSFTVPPFTHYKVTFKLKGKFSGDADELIRVNSLSEGKRWISRSTPRIDANAEEQTIHYTFNTLEASQIRIKFNPGSAKIEDCSIALAGTLLLARRPQIPLTVTSEDGKTVYEEGKDFAEVRDADMLKSPFDGNFTVNREPAALKLTDNSRIKDGEKLKVSFWHGIRVGTDQDGITLEDPKGFEVLERDLKNCIKVWKPDALFLNYDEIRVAGWEPQIDDEGKPLPPEKHLKPGALLAKHFKKAVDTCRRLVPGVALYTWSDMFTPHHNARPFPVKGYYYLVNGNWDGSWEGLDKDIGILNWYAPKAEGLKFFADRGHAQILCGYYDGTSPEKMKQNVTNWMKVSEGQANIRGFMYTTWKNNYTNLKPYFELVDTYAQWGKGGAVTKEKEPGVKE